MNVLRARRLDAWIAIFVMALAALAPTVSHALAWRSAVPDYWADVCMVAAPSSPSAAQAVGAESAGKLPAAGPLDHCPLCLLSSDRLGPAPGGSSCPLAHGDPVAPVVQPALSFRSLILLAAHARGPPVDPPAHFGV